MISSASPRPARCPPSPAAMTWATEGVFGPPCRSSDSTPRPAKWPLASARYHADHSMSGTQLNWVPHRAQRLAARRRGGGVTGLRRRGLPPSVVVAPSASVVPAGASSVVSVAASPSSSPHAAARSARAATSTSTVRTVRTRPGWSCSSVVTLVCLHGILLLSVSGGSDGSRGSAPPGVDRPFEPAGHGEDRDRHDDDDQRGAEGAADRSSSWYEYENSTPRPSRPMRLSPTTAAMTAEPAAIRMPLAMWGTASGTTTSRNRAAPTPPERVDTSSVERRVAVEPGPGVDEDRVEHQHARRGGGRCPAGSRRSGRTAGTARRAAWRPARPPAGPSCRPAPATGRRPAPRPSPAAVPEDERGRRRREGRRGRRQ